MRPERRNRPGGATIEVKRESTRIGVILEVDSTSARMDRVILSDAFDLAGRASNRLVHDPGWWVAVVAAAYVNFGLLCVVQRVPERLDRHIEVIVQPSSFGCEHPEWPMVTLAPGAPALDLRGEAALRLGPTDGDLISYAAALPTIEGKPTLADLRRMFDMGVLGWEPGENRGGRRKIVVAP